MIKKNILKTIFADDSEETRMKLFQDRVRIVEKCAPDVTTSLAEYVRKTAGVRDKGRKIGQALDEFATAETVSLSMKKQMSLFAAVIYEVEKKRDLYVVRMEDVLNEISEYQKSCKNVKQEIKETIALEEKAKMRQLHLARIQEGNHREPQLLQLAESELIKARHEVTRSTKSTEEQVDIFEKRKLEGFRSALIDWTTAELRFHSQALQYFTQAYRIAAAINTNADIEAFRNSLNITETPRLETVKETSFQRSEALLHMLSGSLNGRSTSRASSISSGSRSTMQVGKVI